MKQTIKFRLHRTISQEQNLHEIFTIYNRIRRIGYNLFFEERDILFSENIHARNELKKEIQQSLMHICHNNPYVNSILTDCETKLAQQQSWFEKRKSYLTHQITTILEKIERIKETDKKDRRLRGLYSRLSSIQNKLFTLRFKPVVFGTKQLFRQRILGKISKDEFKIRRDSSFCCIGKRQGINLNLKLHSDMTLRIHTFSKEKGQKWLIIPFTVNYTQEKWFNVFIKVYY